MEKTYGQIAYEAYREATGEIRHQTGEDIPTWEEQKAGIRNAWESVGEAVAQDVKTWCGVPDHVESSTPFQL